MIYVRRWCLALLVVVALPAFSDESRSLVLLNELGIKNLKYPAQQVWVAGQPSQEQIQKLGNAGITHVINLRPEAETDWQEDAMLKAQGIVFHRLPVAGVADLNYDKAAELDRLLGRLQGENVLVHCASGNRVGGLVALQAHAQGESEDAAIEKGKAWGLTRLEKHVRRVASTEKVEDQCQIESC